MGVKGGRGQGWWVSGGGGDQEVVKSGCRGWWGQGVEGQGVGGGRVRG